VQRLTVDHHAAFALEAANRAIFSRNRSISVYRSSSLPLVFLQTLLIFSSGLASRRSVMLIRPSETRGSPAGR
jgi:hypothetical protein